MSENNEWKTVVEADTQGLTWGYITTRVQIKHTNDITDLSKIKDRIKEEKLCSRILFICEEEFIKDNKSWNNNLNKMRKAVLDELNGLYGIYRWVDNREGLSSFSITVPSLQLSTRIGIVYITHTRGVFLIDWSQSMLDCNVNDIFSDKILPTGESYSKRYKVNNIENLRTTFDKIVNHEINYSKYQLDLTKV